MKILRIYTGDDGESHFGEMDVALEPAVDVGLLSKLYPVRGIIFRETPGTYDLDFHNAPRRQFVINLRGGVEIVVGDGSRRRIGPGEMFLAEDTQGRGHISRAIDNQPRTSVLVTLED
ncbi:MAG TPA: hypothetical protein VGC20_12125 [bacterium]